MAIRPRATATVLLTLAGCVAACDLGEPPLRHADTTQHEPAVPERASRASESAPSPRSSFNRISSSSRAPAKKPTSSASHEIQPGSRACENARSGVQNLESSVAAMEREVERLEDESGDIQETVGSRDHYERRLDVARERLEQAEESLSDYVDAQRQQGIPPGCLR